MEESLELFGIIKKGMGIRDIDLVDYSPLVLAYIGDSIYEIIVRTCVVTKGNTQVNKLHKKSSSYVNAHSQAVIIMSLMDKLTDEEIRIYKRGRNAKSVTMAKNATISDYKKATGFEALMGYLYLNNETDRMLELMKSGLDYLEKNENSRNGEECACRMEKV